MYIKSPQLEATIAANIDETHQANAEDDDVRVGGDDDVRVGGDEGRWNTWISSVAFHTSHQMLQNSHAKCFT